MIQSLPPPPAGYVHVCLSICHLVFGGVSLMYLSPKQYSRLRGMQLISAPLECFREF